MVRGFFRPRPWLASPAAVHHDGVYARLVHALARGQHSPVGKDAHSQPNGSDLLTRAFIDTGKPVVVLITQFTYSCTITLRKVGWIGYLNSTTDKEKLFRI